MTKNDKTSCMDAMLRVLSNNITDNSNFINDDLYKTGAQIIYTSAIKCMQSVDASRTPCNIRVAGDTFDYDVNKNNRFRLRTSADTYIRMGNAIIGNIDVYIDTLNLIPIKFPAIIVNVLPATNANINITPDLLNHGMRVSLFDVGICTDDQLTVLEFITKCCNGNDYDEDAEIKQKMYDAFIVKAFDLREKLLDACYYKYDQNNDE